MRTTLATLASAVMFAGLAFGTPAQATPDAGGPVSNVDRIAKLYPNSNVTVTGDIRVVDYQVSKDGSAGSVTFDGVGTVNVTPKPKPDSLVQGIAIVDVGGGTWKYGSTMNAAGQKSCISYYTHNTRDHSSSVRMDLYSKGEAGPRETSYARVTRYTRTTCSTYYNRS